MKWNPPRLLHKNGYWFIIRNGQSFINPETGKREYPRETLDKLGKISKREAEDRYRQFLRTFDQNTTDKDELSFGDLLNRFQNYYQNQIDVSITEASFRNFISKRKKLKHLESIEADKLNFSHVEDIKAKMKKQGYDNRYVNLVLNEVSKAYKFGVRSRLVETMPIIDKMPQAKKEITTLNDTQIRIIFRKLKDFEPEKSQKLKFYITLALLTGIRAAEINRMTWSNIDFKNRIIQIRKNRSHNNPLKGDHLKRDGDIPMTDAVYNLLMDEWRRDGHSRQRVSPYSKHVGIGFQTLSRKCGFNITTTMLRKTYASKMRDTGHIKDDLADYMRTSSKMLDGHYVKRDLEKIRQQMENDSQELASLVS